ncbi:head decoration protein [Cytobacillus firmus]|uniref:head decoration protein n=1 Tax=Cytobacillus firmus TaxID=1399 RepID=UPI0018CFA705|nr:head decoration protein [Cytobacillus firmus]MBG9548394.1 hypothetical protein [Cytobacillus firmus]MBG9604514.1 hypothetical protein [Cytobacillus firmus]MED1942130.1 head decoration protein [Cytobacillus firmus]
MNLVNKNIGESSVDNLFNDVTVPLLTKSVKLQAGQGVLLRGTVLGVITASGLAVTVNSANTDGSEKADCILTDDVDTGTTDPVVATAYSSGLFNANALIVGGTDTVDKHKKELRTLGIFIKESLTY